MGSSKSKLQKKKFCNVKPFLYGKLILCKVIEIENFHTYKIGFKYNKYIIWNCTIPEVIKGLVDKSDKRKSNLIKKDDILYVFVHGLRNDILICDFYNKKNSEISINKIIVEQMQQSLYQECYLNTFNITKIQKENNKTNRSKIETYSSINNMINEPNTLSIKNKFHTQKNINFLEELKLKQEQIN